MREMAGDARTKCSEHAQCRPGAPCEEEGGSSKQAAALRGIPLSIKQSEMGGGGGYPRSQDNSLAKLIIQTAESPVQEIVPSIMEGGVGGGSWLSPFPMAT